LTSQTERSPRRTTRTKAALACKQCGNRNYRTTRQRGARPLELKKFCSQCNAHTVHVETK